MQWLAGLQLLLTAAVGAAATDVPFKEYIYAPSSRTIRPASVHRANGTVSGGHSVLASATLPGALTITGNSSGITYDFEKNIGGWVTLEVTNAPSSPQDILVTFSESSLWINPLACDATADAGLDSPLPFTIDGPGNYTAPYEKDRGAFRYLTVSLNSTGSVEIGGVSVHFTAMPHLGDEEGGLQQYQGWFHSNDEQLNRIWYAGAYTSQLCTINQDRGDALIHIRVINAGDVVQGTTSWYLNTTIANGTTTGVLTDGAKRDRLIWPGDMAVAVPGIAVSTADFPSVINSLDSLFAQQNASTGLLPYASSPFPATVSFTYHLYSLIGLSTIYQWTGDLSYVKKHWAGFKAGVKWSVGQIDCTGLANVTATADWLRVGMGAHNIEANAILYYTLQEGAKLAMAMNESDVALSYQNYSTAIKAAANTLLWDDEADLFRDNQTTTLMPQDGNVWAVKSGLVDEDRAVRISQAVQKRWTKFGAPAPEGGATISPFISSFELEAHFMVGRTAAGLELIRMMWGDFMMDDPRMTNSTFIEGYSTDGSLHYPAYESDPRVSHAHGWSTGPTSALTNYVAGLSLLTPAGATWSVAPQLGDLTNVEAGFSTSLGQFSVSWSVSNDSLLLHVSAPAGTKGKIGIPTKGNPKKLDLASSNEKAMSPNWANDGSGRYWIDVEGGDWEVRVQE